MGSVTILKDTTRNPISMIGEMAGICWGGDVEDEAKNYKRGMNCILSGHGRTFEYPSVYVKFSGYSARVIRELYTHIGGLPTRLQQSTRYIDYNNFEYVIPQSINKDVNAKKVYMNTIHDIQYALSKLEEYNIPREDAALLLPLGMQTDIVCKYNARTLIDMSRQRMCVRAYHEFRQLMNDLCSALSNYSTEWNKLVSIEFRPKCEILGYCPEENGCGKYPNKEVSEDEYSV